MGPYKSIEDIPSRYQFVHVVARRARKLQGGARPIATAPASRKPTRIAEQEAMSGMLEFVLIGSRQSDAAAEEEEKAGGEA